MMALPFKSLPFLELVMEKPGLMVLWAAFGVPLLIGLLSYISQSYKHYKYAESIEAVLYASLSFTWLFGFILMIILLSSRVPGIKLYFIWITIFVSSLVFAGINNKAIIKYVSMFREFKRKSE